MKKFLFILILFLPFNTTRIFAQITDSYTCYNLDSDADTAFNKTMMSSDSSYDCIAIYGMDSKTQLDNIFSCIVFKDKIRKIELIYFSGKSVPVSVKNFTNLNELVIENSPNIRFKKLFSDLKHTTNLQKINLIDNGKADIPKNIRDIRSLAKLKISDYDYADANKLLKSLAALPELKELEISSVNNLKISYETPVPKTLQNLILPDNSMSFIPGDINNARNLQYLDISDNNFSDVDEIIRCTDSLQLKNFAITCLDARDSAVIVKTFPGTQLQIAVYREPSNVETYYSKKYISPAEVAINNYYKKTLKPPIGRCEIIRRNYSVDNGKNTAVNYCTGTTINIPENAFIDLLGNAVKGNVDIYYREFDDIIDIFANGVPMGYDSAGQQYSFRSAGMFEIYAFKDNKAVFLAPDKKITFDFATIDTNAGFNLYRLDLNTGKWDFQSPLPNALTKKKREFSPAYKRYNDLFNMRFDTTCFDDRYNDSLYAHTTKIPFDYFKGKKRLLTQFFKLKRFYNKNKVFKKAVNFKILIDKYGIYKEIIPFRSYTWVYEGNLTKSEFNKKYVSRKKWTDLRLVYDEASDIFKIELKSPHEFATLDAYPIKPSYKAGKEKYLKVYQKLAARYNKTINKIRTHFDSRIKKKIERCKKNVWNLIRREMTPDEKLMTTEEWIAYAKKRLDTEKDSINNQQASQYIITRSFQIDGFGIWNCDQIMRMKNPVQLNASFKDVFDNKIEPSVIYVIDGLNKSIFSYSNQNIIIDPYSKPAMIVFRTNGSIALVDKNTIKNTIFASPAKNNYIFNAYPVESKTLTTGELRKLLGF